MESITVVEETLGWLIRGFPFWFQLFVVWLVSSRLLLKDYGAERLVWEENWRIQLGSLFAIGLLVGTSLYTWFLLDQPERSITFFRELLPTWSLFSTDELNPMTRPGRFLLFGMLGFGMVLFAAKFVALVRVWRRASADRRNGYPAASAYARARWWLLPGLIGYALAFGFPIGLYHLDQACGIRPIIVKQLEKMPGS